MSYASWEPLPNLDKSVLEGCIDVSRRKLLLDGKYFYYDVKKNIFYVSQSGRISLVEDPFTRQELLEYNKEKIENFKRQSS